MGRIFERFDANGDGGLDRDEMAALVVAVNPRVKFSEDQISAILDEVFRTYAEFILPGGRGLSLPGLLRTYDDGAGDVDRDFLALSLPPLESGESSRRSPRGPGRRLVPALRRRRRRVAPGRPHQAAWSSRWGALVQLTRRGGRAGVGDVAQPRDCVRLLLGAPRRPGDTSEAPPLQAAAENILHRHDQRQRRRGEQQFRLLLRGRVVKGDLRPSGFGFDRRAMGRDEPRLPHLRQGARRAPHARGRLPLTGGGLRQSHGHRQGALRAPPLPGRA